MYPWLCIRTLDTSHVYAVKIMVKGGEGNQKRKKNGDGGNQKRKKNGGGGNIFL